MKARASILILAVAFAGLSACAADPRMPQSVYQWERRQQQIEHDWRAGQARDVTAQKTSTNGAPAPEDRF